MFDQVDAERLALALEAMGYDASPQLIGRTEWGVWCETAGLLLQDLAAMKRWLSLRWAQELSQGVIDYG